ncbi:MAG: AAA family ATPase [Cyclobacteriaceae bacterium]
MKELLKELSIENYRGFFSKQTIYFGVPNGENAGSGLTVVVGQNNSGKNSFFAWSSVQK